MRRFIETGKKDATLIIGNYRKNNGGLYVLPTWFVTPESKATIDEDEISSPVGHIRTLETVNEVLQMASDSHHGLAFKGRFLKSEP